MEFKATAKKIDMHTAEALALFFFSDERPLTGSSGLVDWRLCGQISRLLIDGSVSGDLGERVLLPPQGKITVDKVPLLGLGLSGAYSFDRYSQTASWVAESLRRMRITSVAMTLPGLDIVEMDHALAAQKLVDELILHYRDDPDLMSTLSLILVVASKKVREVSAVLERQRRRLADWNPQKSRAPGRANY